MRRSLGSIVVACVLVAACSSSGDDSASPTTAAATADTSTESTSAESTLGSADVPSDVADGRPDLPGLLDDSNEKIRNDAAVRVGVLDNGLRYYIRGNDNPGGKADLRLAIKAGSVDEYGPSTGVAHFVEHMLFNGTEQFPENELIDVLRSFGAAFGADINAYTTLRRDGLRTDRPEPTAAVPGRADRAGTVAVARHLRRGPGRRRAWRRARRVARADPEHATDGCSRWRSYVSRRHCLRRSVADRDRRFDLRDDATSSCASTTTPGTGPTTRRSSWSATSTSTTSRPTSSACSARRSHRAEPRTAIEVRVRVDLEPAYGLHADPDQRTVDVEVTLPLPAFDGNGTASWRLRADRSDHRFGARTSPRSGHRRRHGPVRPDRSWHEQLRRRPRCARRCIPAPTSVASTPPCRRCWTSTNGRAASASATTRSTSPRAPCEPTTTRSYAGRDSAQDAQFADDYVDHFLTGSAYPSIADDYELSIGLLEAITAEAVDLRFRARLGKHGTTRDHLDARGGVGEHAERERGAGDDR